MFVSAIVLAAGLSSRMGHNKLIVHIDGKPMLRRVAEAALTSGARPVFVVTGHASECVRGTLAGLDVCAIGNPDYREGLAASIRTGVAAIPPSSEGVLIIPGDMPLISADLIGRVIAASQADAACSICVASHRGQRGHPVLFGRRYFSDLLALSGDIGARSVIARHETEVCEVEAGDEAPLVDIDTPAALAKFQASQI